MTRPSILFVASVGLLCSACDELAPDPQPKPLPEQQVETLEATIEELDNEFEGMGIALAVRTGSGAQWAGALGLRNLRTPLEAGDVAQFGSVTKTVTATVTLQLVEEGLLSLDDTIDTFGIDLPHADTITVQQLLSHRSGLFNYTDDEAFMASLGETPQTADAVFDVVDDYEPLFPPGAAWTYSNTNYMALGVILESVTGQPLEDIFYARVFGPLGMEDTGLTDRDPIPGPLAHGFMEEDGVLEDVTFAFNKRAQGPDGALFSTLDDMLTWSHALYGGELLDPETLEAVVAPRSAEIVSPVAAAYGFEGGDYGLGTIVLEDELLGAVWGHAGNIRGYTAYVGYVPTLDVAVAFYTTQDSADGLVAARQIATALHDFDR
ncbi:MAG: serine hydrolase domain-containing protein [Nannocystales bacterium]